MNELNEVSLPEGQNKKEEKKFKNCKGKGRRKFVIGAFLVFFIIAGVVGVSVAKNKIDKFRGHGPFGFIMEHVVKDLDLTDQQKKEVDKIREEVKAKMDEKKKDRDSEMEKMEQMFRSDNFDKQLALDMAKKHEADREEMRNFFIEETAKFHSILTTEQRNKAADKMKEFRENKDKFFRDKQHDRGDKPFREGPPRDKQ